MSRAIHHILSACIAICTFILPQSFRFDRISIEQGLPQSHITSMLQDRNGLLWFGTSDGLNRFDGYQFETNRYNPSDTNSISGNDIYTIDQDRSGNLWIVTSGGGINRLDQITRHFAHYRTSADAPYSLSADNVTAFLEDKRGNIWLGTHGGGLNLYLAKTDRFLHFKHDPEDPLSLSNNVIGNLFEDENHSIWIGTHGGGLNRLRLNESTLRQLAAADSLIAVAMETGPIPADHPIEYPGLQFERYYAQGLSYVEELYAEIDSLSRRQRQISSISEVGNDQDATEYFEMSEGGSVLVVAMGDATTYGLSDLGWIEQEGGGAATVWEMSYDHSAHAGGATRNRIQVDVLRLKRGNYTLRYRSDHKHSFHQWTTPPPLHEQHWGIQLFTLTAQEAAMFAALSRKKMTPNSLPHNWVTAIDQTHRDELWVGTAEGLARLTHLNASVPAFDVYKHKAHNPNSLSHSHIKSIHHPGDRPGRFVWVCTGDNGINLVESESPVVMRILSDELGGSGSGDDITAIQYDRNGALWLGTERNGLKRVRLNEAATRDMDPGLEEGEPGGGQIRVTNFVHRPGDPNSLSENSITALFEDRSGLLWIGTQRGGINKIDLRAKQFIHFSHQEESPNSLSAPVVTAVIEDSGGDLWIGTSGGGLDRLRRDATHPRQATYRHYRHLPDDDNSISSDYVTAVYLDRQRVDGNLWIGSSGGGLNRLDTSSGYFQRYRFDPQNKNSIAGDDINTIGGDRDGFIWIGTKSGLTRLDPDAGHFVQYRTQADDQASLSFNDVTVILEDRDPDAAFLWIGTRGGGLNRFNRNTGAFIRHTRVFGDSNSLNNPDVLSLFQDRKGNLWVGTGGGGLNLLAPNSACFDAYTENHGLGNNMVFGILEDDKQRLWLSTNRGISRFDTGTIQFINYDVYDGLQGNEFVAGASFMSDRGEMFFGGINGLNSFFPDSIKSNPYVPPLIISAFSVLGKSAWSRVATAQKKGSAIELSYNENYIGFEFAALDYTNPRKNQYAHMLEGLEKSWMPEDRRFVNYTNLAPGEYTFRVRGSNNDGVWNETGIAIRLLIHPPFWRTWWFYLITIVAITVSSIGFHRFRLRVKLRRILELEQVRQQENERVRAQAAHDFHDELGHRVTKISLFSELVKRQLEEASPEVKEYLNRIGETAKGLTGGMRDFIWTLDPGKDTLQEVIVHLKDFGDTLFDKTGVAFRVEGLSGTLEDVRLNMEWRRHIMLIFKEAMHNALKHARCKNVTLSVVHREGNVRLSLEDDGSGMGAGSLTRDENGYWIKENAAGRAANGTGLQSMQTRTKKIQGKLEFEATSEGGTRVVFAGALPVIEK